MSLGNIFASLHDAIGSMTSKSISHYSMLETVAEDNPYIIVGKDGSLLTLLKIDGVKQVMGPEEYTRTIDILSTRLASYFGQPGHAMQIWFSRDPDLAEEIIRQQIAPQRRVANAIGLDLEDVFRERERVLPQHVVHEGYYMALWTRLGAMTKVERGNLKKTSRAPEGWPAQGDAQDIFRAAKPLVDRHVAFVKNFHADLNSVYIRSRILDGHTALSAIRSSLDPSMTNSDWKPYLPGDPIPTRHHDGRAGDASHLLWPRLDEQLFKHEATRMNPRVVEMNGRLFASVDMTIGPMEQQPFSLLIRRMMEIGEFPWRVSFLIEGGGLDYIQMKKMIASIFTLTNQQNRAIKNAISDLQEARTQENLVVCKLRTSFCTWTPVGENGMGVIEERLARLQRAVEGWGYCSVSSSSGDPLSGVMSSTLGLNPGSTAPAGAVPLGDLISLLPLDRDASPLSKGSILFRTADGRVWPWAPGTSLMDTFSDLIFAPPGKGKSVFLNSAALSLCLSHIATQGIGGSKLPRISTIDIGTSSSGQINLIKEALPPSRRHEAEYRRLKNEARYAINPFDTQLGCRFPSSSERAFLVNFLSALGTPVGQKTPPPSLPDLAGFCIDELYALRADKAANSQPQSYVPQIDRELDEALRRHNINVDMATPFWAIVDALFQRGDKHAASLAQRHAVPRLDDLTQVLNSKKITDIYGDAMMSTSEPLVKGFERMVIAALSDYPIMAYPTQFDIGNARVVSLDIDEVCPRGAGPAEKQTALMYMLARFVLARDFYLDEDFLKARTKNEDVVPEMYREYHQQRIRRIRETPKRLVYDEFHRTASSAAVRQQVLVDMREGRKWGVHIALASQLLDDFDESMVSLSSAFWIMGVNTETDVTKAKEVFGLTNTGADIVRRYLTGPGPKGAPFLAVLNLRDGKHEHFLYNTLGPTEIWAFSTTAEDAGIRNRLYEALGAVEARRRLAIAYPSGSAKADIDIRMQRISERGETVDKAENGVIHQIVEELINRKM